MINETTYNEYKSRYRKWAEQYTSGNGWISVPAGHTPPAEANSTNEERTAMEVYEWHRDKPDRYFLYVNPETRKGTTWTGEELGYICFGREWRSNMGDTRVAINLFGNNGVVYHGVYYKSAGDYARVTAYKEQ